MISSNKKNTLLILILFFTCCTYSFGAVNKLKKVLIIDSFHRSYHWTEAISKGIEKELRKHFSDIEFHHEYMDAKRYTSSELLKIFKIKMLVKYKNIKFDLILADSLEAFDFMMASGKKTFGNTPFVFAGLYKIKPQQINGRKNYTGVIASINYTQSIDLSLRIIKNPSTYYVITDATATGDNYNKMFLSILKRRNINFKILSGRDYSLDELTSILSKADKNSVVLHTLWLKDKSKDYTYKYSAKRIAASSAVPVYTFVYPFAGTGIIGGAIFNPGDYAISVAKKAKRILLGENPANISIAYYGFHRNTFDYNALKKWNIDASKYFKNSRILNIPMAFFEIHLKKISVIISVLFVFSFLIILILLNIFRRKKAEEAGRKQKMLFDKVVDFMPFPIFIVNDNSQTIYINKKYMEILGYELSDINTMEKTVKNFFPNPEYRAERLASWEKITENIDAIDFAEEEAEITAKDGTIITVRGTFKNIPPIGLLAILKDITAEKRYELSTKEFITTLEHAYKEKEDALKDVEQTKFLLEVNNAKLEELYQKAEEASRIKSEFLAIMSHEIRTPLTSMIGYSQLLLTENKLKGKEIKFVKIINESGTRLLKLLTDLLELSVIEAKGVQAEYDIFDIRKVVDDVYTLLAPKFDEKNLSFEKNLNSVNFVYSDQLKIRQIIFNLVGNAVKFTPTGKISVFIEKKGKRFLITVKDTGIGISQENFKAIFELFRQAEKAHKRRYGGTGLGLAICQKLVETLCGKIWVESEVAKGTTFFVELPALDIPERAFEYDPEITKIILFDVEIKTLPLLHKLFELGSKLKTKSVTVIEEVESELKRAGSKIVIVSLLSNISASDDIIKRIRAIKKNTKIVAIANEGDCAKLKEAGYNACYTWPISSMELMQLIDYAKNIITH
jgi:PAS domain S-box-containing protein